MTPFRCNLIPAFAAVLAAPLAAPLASAGSHTQTIDFESFTHGQIIHTQQPGLTIRATNRGGGPDLAVAFDSTLRGTRDPDLQGPNGSNGAWDRGNIAGNQVLGMMLIVQENSVGVGDGFADRPDDEGSRPAGSLFFEFARAITSFGFDLIDVEGVEEFGQDSGYFATFHDADAEVRVGFDELITPASGFYDPDIAFGNNSANRVAPITAEQLGLERFDRVELNFGGSAAVDNIQYTAVPTPTAVAGGLLLGLGLLTCRRRSADEQT